MSAHRVGRLILAIVIAVPAAPAEMCGQTAEAHASEGTEFWLALPHLPKYDADVGGPNPRPRDLPMVPGVSARYGLIIQTSYQPLAPDESVHVSLSYFDGNGLEHFLQVCTSAGAYCTESELVDGGDLHVAPGSPLFLGIPPQANGAQDLVLDDDAPDSVDPNNTPANSIRYNGIHLSASAPISAIVYARPTAGLFFTDAYRALPLGRLGRHYAAISWCRRPMYLGTKPPSRVTVLAPYNNTHVTYSARWFGCEDSVQKCCDLGRGQTFQIHEPFGTQECGAEELWPHLYTERDGSLRAPDGYAIEVWADKPVAVLTSSDSAIVSTPHNDDSGLLLEQVLPTSAYGTDYLIPALSQEQHHYGTAVKFVATQDDTNVWIYQDIDDAGSPSFPWVVDPDTGVAVLHLPLSPQEASIAHDEWPTVLNSGDVIEPLVLETLVPLDGPPDYNAARIIADKPIGVAVAGRSNKGGCTDNDQEHAEIGRPFQMTVLPETEFQSECRFSAIPWYADAACGTLTQYLMVVRPGSESDQTVTIVLTRPDGSSTQADPFGATWHTMPGPVGSDVYSIGWTQLYERSSTTVTGQLGEWTMRAYRTDDPAVGVPVAAYVVITGVDTTVGYPACFAPAPPLPVEDVIVTDVLPSSDVEPVPGTFSQPPLDESDRHLTWRLDELPSGTDPVEVAYDALLRHLEPNTDKVISEETLLSYVDEGRPVLRREGPASVHVTGSPAQLGISVLRDPPPSGGPPAFISPEPADFEISFVPPDFLTRATFSSPTDFADPALTELSGVNGHERPGSLVLDHDGGDATAYAASGTARFTVDAGGLVDWIGIGYDGGLAGTRVLDTPGLLSGAEIRDVELVEIDPQSGGSQPWWSNPAKSWYTMADHTAVDNALSTEDGGPDATGAVVPAYVRVPRRSALENLWQESYTVEGWMWSEDLPDGQVQTLLWAKSVDADGSPGDGPSIHLYREGNEFKVDVTYFVDGTLTTWTGSTGSLNPAWSDAEWHHIALVVDRTGLTPAAVLRVNSVSVPINEIPAITIAGELRLGSDDSPDDECYSGRLDEIRLYDRPLANAELDDHKLDVEAHAPPRHSAGLVGYWNFDPSAEDQSGAALGGEFVGAARITGRSSDAAFPRRSYIVATEGGVDIIDADDGSLWMRFLADRPFLFYTEYGVAASGPDEVAMDRGRLVVMTKLGTRFDQYGSTLADSPLSVVDFVDDRVLSLYRGGFLRIDTADPAEVMLSDHMNTEPLTQTSSAPDDWPDLNLYGHCLTAMDIEASGEGSMLALASVDTDDRVLLLAVDWSGDTSVTGTALVNEVHDFGDLFPLRISDMALVPGTNSTDLYCRHDAVIIQDDMTTAGSVPVVDRLNAGDVLLRTGLQQATSSGLTYAYCWQPSARYGAMPASSVPGITAGRLFDYFPTEPGGSGLAVDSGASTRETGANVIYFGTRNGLIRIDEDRHNEANERAIVLVPDDGEALPLGGEAVLAGSSRYVSGVVLRSVEGGQKQVWVGTADWNGGDGAVSILDAASLDDADPVRLGEMTEDTTPSLPGASVLGMFEGPLVLTERGLADSLEGAGVEAGSGSSEGAPPITIRLRSAQSREAFAVLDADPSGRAGFSDPIAFEQQESPPAGARRAGFWATVPDDIPPARFLQIEATFESQDQHVTPILDDLFATFTSSTLAIDVTVEGDSDGQETEGPLATSVSEIRLTASDLTPSGNPVSPVAWTRQFSTGAVIPGSYRARATLVNTESDQTLLTASAPFDVVSPPLSEVIANSVRTDRPQYTAHEEVEISSIVGNETLNVPLKDLVVRLRIARGVTEYMSTSYRIARLEPNAQPDLHREYFTVKPDLPAAHGYVVRQEVMMGNVVVATADTDFDVVAVPDLTGSIAVTPQAVGGAERLVKVTCTATNVGNQDLTEVTLYVTISPSDPSDPDAPAPAAFRAWAGDMARGERFDGFVIPYDAPPWDGTYTVDLEASAAQFPRQHLDQDVFIVSDTENVPPTTRAYLAIDLDVLDGDTESTALSINEAGDVVGYSGTGATRRAVLWRCGQIYALPGAAAPSQANSISDDGYVVGSLTSAGNERGFLWFSDPGSPVVLSTPAVELGTLGGATSSALAISNGAGLNRIVGSAAGTGGLLAFQTTADAAVLSPISLSVPGLTGSAAAAVNDYGDIIGSYEASGETGGFIVQDGQVSILPSFLADDEVELMDVSNAGRTVGTAFDAAGEETALVADGRVMRQLPQPAGSSAAAMAISDAGQIVGQTDGLATLWDRGEWHDLTSLVVNQGCWDGISVATDVSASGLIVGSGVRSGSSYTHAVRLEPLPFDAALLTDLELWVRADAMAKTDAAGVLLQWEGLTCAPDRDLVPGGGAPEWFSPTCCNPSIAFDGVDDWASQAAPLGAAVSDFSLFVVAEIGDSDGVLLGTGDAAAPDPESIELRFAGNEVQIWRTGDDPAGSPILSGPAGRGLALYTIQAIDDDPSSTSDDRLELRVNGALVDVAHDPTSMATLSLGAGVGGSGALNCTVEEVMTFSSSLSPTDREAIEDYLGAKHDVVRSESIGAPVLWLRADRGVEVDGAGVREWTNQAGPTGGLSQDLSAQRPLLGSGGESCQPQLEFDADAQHYLVAADLARHLDVVLTVDCSGSMGIDTNLQPTWRIETAKVAGQNFLRDVLLDEGSKVGLVWFSWWPDVHPDSVTACNGMLGGTCDEDGDGDGNGCDPGHGDYGLIDLTTDMSAAAVCSENTAYSIDYALTTDGFTEENGTVARVPHGIQAVSQSETDYSGALAGLKLAFNGSVSNDRVAVFLSDGKPYGGGSDETIDGLTSDLADLGVTLYTVGIGDGLASGDVERLERMAGLTGGSYKHVESDASNLGAVLDEIRGEADVVRRSGTLSVVFGCPPAAAVSEPIITIGRAAQTSTDPAAGLSVWRTSADQLEVVLWGQYEDGNLWTKSISTPIACNGDLNHLQVEFEGQGDSGSLRAFLNGQSFSTDAVLGPGEDVAISSGAIVLGGAPLLGDGRDGTRTASGSIVNQRYFTGTVAELMLYAHVLSPDEGEALADYVNRKYRLVPASNLPPIARAGPDQPGVEDFGWNGTEPISLDGSASVDPDGDGAALIYAWYEGGEQIASGPHPIVSLPMGSHTIELRVTDPGQLTATDTLVVSVSPLSDGRLVHYRFDRWYGDDAKKAFDSSGNGFDVPISLLSEPVYADGRDEFSLVFDEGTWVDLSEQLVKPGYFPQGSAARTFSAWFEARDQGATATAALFDYGGWEPGQRFRVIADQQTVAVDFGGEIRGVDGLALSPEWHHVAVVIPSGAGWSDQVRLYLDGEPVTSTTLAGSGAVPIQTGAAFGYIGRSAEGAPHIGRVDDVRLYAMEIDVGSIFHEPPLFHWKMNEGQGTTIADTTTIYPENGLFALVGSAEWKSEPYPRTSFLAFSEDTTRTQEDLPIDLEGVKGITVTAWVRVYQQGPILSQEADEHVITWLGVSPTGVYSGLYGDQVEAEFDMADKWHFVVMSASGEGLEFAVDGKVIDGFDGSGWPSVNGPLKFGGADATGLFKGDLDDIRLYDRPFKQPDIEDLYKRLVKP